MTTKDEKNRRMELRRSIDNRVIAEQIKRSGGPNYYLSYCCFDCRKSFKQIPDLDFHTCPECSEELNEMGRNFTPPKRKNDKQWDKVVLLYTHGYRFNAYNFEGGGQYPKSLDEAKLFIKERGFGPFYDES